MLAAKAAFAGALFLIATAAAAERIDASHSTVRQDRIYAQWQTTHPMNNQSQSSNCRTVRRPDGRTSLECH
jgi:hypothetical protein